jgi:hypothetical protein
MSTIFIFPRLRQGVLDMGFCLNNGAVSPDPLWCSGWKSWFMSKNGRTIYRQNNDLLWFGVGILANASWYKSRIFLKTHLLFQKARYSFKKHIYFFEKYVYFSKKHIYFLKKHTSISEKHVCFSGKHT